MKIRTLISGNHGTGAFDVGVELDFDSDYVRKLLVNGLAEPLDEQAQNFLAKPDQHDPYVSAAYQKIAEELQAAAAQGE